MRETLEFLKEELKKVRKKAGIYASDASEVQRLEEEIEELKKLIKSEEGKR